MTFLVTESCIRCKHTDCVETCPVDAFREGPNFLAIAPDDCIDCGLCVPECPVEAIYADAQLPEEQAGFLVLNRELAALWPPITRKVAAPPDAAAWSERKGKLQELRR